jgi:hypothetical protein
MTYHTKNDYRHSIGFYKDVDAAAISWTDIQTNTVARFLRQHHMGELLSEFIARTGAPF